MYLKKPERITLTATIVLYNNDVEVLQEAIDSFLNTPIDKKLFLVDNSPSNVLQDTFKHPDVEYIFLNKNIGFGSGHNQVMEKIKDYSEFHLILNPDVSFEPQVLIKLIETLKAKDLIAMIAPKVKYLNNEHQYTCRRYPSFLELMSRRLPLLNKVFAKKIYYGEYRDKDLNVPFYAEYLSGCFQLYKTADFVKIDGFDERYFMYVEDIDICKKIDTISKKKLYYPLEFIYHGFEKGSAKKINLFFYHITSIFKYFCKWKMRKIVK